MSTFFMFGRYSSEAIKGISSDRTKKAVNAIQNLGGKVNSMYVMLGDRDLVLIVDFPGIEEAIRISIEINKLTGISFETYPAIPVETFDKLMSK